MNKTQKNLIFIEIIVITILLWRYLTETLTMEETIIFTLIYVMCMFGWFYYKGGEGD